MLGNTSVRLCIVAAIIPCIYGGAYFVHAKLEPPKVDMPGWTFHELPAQLGDWRGKDTTLDPETAVATGAQIIVDRTYQDESGHAVSMHTAVFENPADGVLHSPLNCYRRSGWERLSLSTEQLKVSDDLTLPVCMSVFQRENEKVVVIYWYQLGEHVLFGRWDLGLNVRWSLAGRPAWPALIKVMLQIPVSELEDAKSTILSFAEQVAQWENLPAHRNGKGMLGTANSGDPSAAP